MSDALIALIAVSSVLVYAVGFGVTWALFYEPSIEEVVLVLCILWPFVLPARGGFTLVRRVQRPRTAKLPRAEVRR